MHFFKKLNQTHPKPRELCGKVSFCLMHVFPGIKKKKKKKEEEEEEEEED